MTTGLAGEHAGHYAPMVLYIISIGKSMVFSVSRVHSISHQFQAIFLLFIFRQINSALCVKSALINSICQIRLYKQTLQPCSVMTCHWLSMCIGNVRDKVKGPFHTSDIWCYRYRPIGTRWIMWSVLCQLPVLSDDVFLDIHFRLG